MRSGAWHTLDQPHPNGPVWMLVHDWPGFHQHDEQCEIMQRHAQMPRFDDLDQVIGAIREIGPGGHFLGTDHTRESFETAFAMPKLIDSNSFAQWEAKGANTRATEYARDLLLRHEPLAMDAGTKEELRAYVRKMEEAQQ